MLDRISYILKVKNLTSAKFADEIGVQRSSVSHVLSGRNKPGFDFVQKLLLCYPDINADWLITGKGRPLNEPESLESRKKQKHQDTIDTNNLFKTEEKSIINTINQTEQHADIKKADKKEKSKVKSIEKIVIFYSDKTFREYNPG